MAAYCMKDSKGVCSNSYFHYTTLHLLTHQTSSITLIRELRIKDDLSYMFIRELHHNCKKHSQKKIRLCIPRAVCTEKFFLTPKRWALFRPNEPAGVRRHDLLKREGLAEGKASSWACPADKPWQGAILHKLGLAQLPGQACKRN
jgi:hypothetical protein